VSARQAIIDLLRRADTPTCANCDRPLGRTWILLASTGNDPPPQPASYVDWRVCSFDCLKLFAERLADAGFDTEWQFLPR
jgi:hypothetical protein